MRTILRTITAAAIVLATSIEPALAQESALKPESSEAGKPECPATVDLDTMTAEQLVCLPGIGETRAATMVQARGELGHLTLDNLSRVRGFGARTVAKLRAFIEAHNARR